MFDFADEVWRIMKWVGLGVVFIVLTLAVAAGVWMGSSKPCPCGAECPCHAPAKP